MNETTAKILYCAIRTAGILGALALSIWAAKVLELTYDDVRTSLKIFDEYFPHFVVLIVFTGVGLVFYKASMSRADFNFVYFFISKPGIHEDISKLVFFLLAIAAICVIFVTLWRGTLTETLIGVILTAFVIERGVAISGKSWGKTRNEGAPNIPTKAPKGAKE